MPWTGMWRIGKPRASAARRRTFQARSPRLDGRKWYCARITGDCYLELKTPNGEIERRAGIDGVKSKTLCPQHQHYGASARHVGIRRAAAPRTRRTNDETSRLQSVGVPATPETPALGSFMTRCASA